MDDYNSILNAISNWHRPTMYIPPRITPQPNVIVPQTGVAKYWYVDPRAAQPLPVPQQMYRAVDYASQFVKPTQENRVAIPLTQKGTPAWNIVAPDQRESQQERADMFDRMRYPGMLEPKNVDDEVAQSTGTFGIDGATYILPTKVNDVELTPEQAVQRYKDTGEHLGAFETPQQANFYETNYLQY